MPYNKSFKNAGQNPACSDAAKGAAPFNSNVRCKKMKYSPPIKWVSIVTVIVFAVIYIMPLELSFKFIFIAIHTFYIILFLFLGTIVINDEGIQLYTINKIKYEEIKGFKKKRFFGIPHIFIVREKGFGWWLPLYYAKKGAIKETLLNHAQNYPKLVADLKCI